MSYTVEANVGGKIAQVGSRLIDMTAKKMADIFFGKFSELVTPEDKKIENISNETSEKKVSRNKLLYIHIAGAIVVLTALAIYFLK